MWKVTPAGDDRMCCRSVAAAQGVEAVILYARQLFVLEHHVFMSCHDFTYVSVHDSAMQLF